MITHLADPQAWAAALASDTRTYVSAGLATEQFIHLSTPDQAPRTFALFYADRTDLVLLDVDEMHPGVAPLLKWEAAPTGEEFPHLYGPLPLDAVVRARPNWRPTPVPRSERFPFGAGYDDGSATYDVSTFDWSAVEAALVDSRNYWITSVRPDGRPHAVPVWGIWLGDVLGFSSGPDAVKSRNLRANPNCVAHLESGDTTVILEGTVEALTGLELDAFVAGYLPKYAIELDASNPEFGFYRMVPSTARTWLEKGFLESATLWTFDRSLRT